MPIYGHSSKKNYTKEENLRFKALEREYRIEEMLSEDGCETPGRSLLDSSLISRTKTKYASHKIIQCGDYYQVYYFPNNKLINDSVVGESNHEKKPVEVTLCKKPLDDDDIDVDYLFKENNLSKKNELKTIEYKNIMRSKFQLQRLVKANENIFKTFITLTFAENITDISEANKNFDNWRRSIKRKFCDFQYVCVPEFQKRGAIHYHLLTNLDINENHDIIIPQKVFTEKQYKKMSEKQRKACYDVKYWTKGYSSVYPLRDMNVVGYITKYMTKDIDNRLWGKRRYLYSQNLKQPSTLYLTLDGEVNIKEFFKYHEMIISTDICFKNTYCDLNGEIIEFIEYKVKKK